MRSDDRTDVLERAQPRAERVADDRMFLHHARFRRVELAVLQQYVIGNANLADVVQEAAALERAEIILPETQRLAEPRRVVGEPLTVAARVRIARLDRCPETENDGFGRFEFVGLPLQAHERSNARVELGVVEGFGEEIVGAGLDAVQALFAIGMRRDDDNRHEARVRLLLQLPADVEGASARRHEIEDDEIRRVRGTTPQRLVGAAGEGYSVSLSCQQSLQKQRARFVVISNKNAGSESHAVSSVQKEDRQVSCNVFRRDCRGIPVQRQIRRHADSV